MNVVRFIQVVLLPYRYWSIVSPIVLGTCLVAITIGADDWPQWRGPGRAYQSSETGLLKSWPDAGPEQVWLFDKAGLGYAGFAVVGDRLYTMGVEDNQEFALCVQAIDGQEIWRQSIGDRFRNGWGDGPRSTPTVDGEKVYFLSASGHLVCLHGEDGKVIWNRTMSEFGGAVPTWGYAESPLVDGDRVYCTPGGRKGAIIALDKRNGIPVWQCQDLTSAAHYSSMVVADHNGQRQLVQLLVDQIVGLNAEDGQLLWRTSWPGQIAVIPTPIFKDGVVYVTSGYGVGSAAYRIGPENEVSELFQNKVMKNHHGGVVEVDGYVYGYSDKVGLVCQNMLDGNQAWRQRRLVSKGAISYADGRFYFVQESDGMVLLLEANPEGVIEQGRFKIAPQTKRRAADGRIWVHPVIANGRLYLRDQEYIYCYDVKEKI